MRADIMKSWPSCCVYSATDVTCSHILIISCCMCADICLQTSEFFCINPTSGLCFHIPLYVIAVLNGHKAIPVRQDIR